QGHRRRANQRSAPLGFGLQVRRSHARHLRLQGGGEVKGRGARGDPALEEVDAERGGLLVRLVGGERPHGQQAPHIARYARRQTRRGAGRWSGLLCGGGDRRGGAEQQDGGQRLR